jgi:hypothetical protein
MLADLGMETERGRDALRDKLVVGAYHGSPQVIAQQLPGNLNYAIYRERAELRVAVLPETPKEAPKPRQDEDKKETLTKVGF